jgi:hypothetical protein
VAVAAVITAMTKTMRLIMSSPGVAVAVNKLIARILRTWERRAPWKHIVYIMKKKV